MFERNLNGVIHFETEEEVKEYINNIFRNYLITGKLDKVTKFHSRKRLFDFYFTVVEMSLILKDFLDININL